MIRVCVAPRLSHHLTASAARIALLNDLFARHDAGEVILRLDDLVRSQPRPELIDGIIRDLRWLGLRWREATRQSERIDFYRDSFEHLKQVGRAYPCFESREELQFKHDQRQKRNRPTVYDRAMLKLTAEQRAAAEANGKRPHWRFRLSDGAATWSDLTLGQASAYLPAISDPVIMDADGNPHPLFAAAVDDISFGITHVIRGEDSLDNSGVQRDLIDALSAAPPRYAHIQGWPEDKATQGRRNPASQSIRTFRTDGVEAVALATFLVHPEADRPPHSLDEFARSFALTHRAPSRMDVASLLRLNRMSLSTTPLEAVADRLPADVTEAFWLAIRGEIDLVTEARALWEMVMGPFVAPTMGHEHDLLQTAADSLPDEPWGRDDIGAWLDHLAEVTCRPRTDVIASIRLALTAEESGPELAVLLPLIGRSQAKDRLRSAGTA
jgi:glutamyl-tRNA synthetase